MLLYFSLGFKKDSFSIDLFKLCVKGNGELIFPFLKLSLHFSILVRIEIDSGKGNYEQK